MKLLGLVSSFREGPMLESAIRSLACMDHVLVYEGPVEDNPPLGPESVVPRGKEWASKLTLVKGAWVSDAAKRTAMVEWVHKRAWLMREGPVWGLWLDGDELLLWGDYLRDWLWAQTELGNEMNPVAHLPLPLVELNGLTVLCLGKVVRIDLIRRYLISSSYMEWLNGERLTLGNIDYWDPVNGALVRTEDGKPHWRARPPLQGEPHLQHRPVLRSKLRGAERQGTAEARHFEGVEL